jgi:glutaminase
MTTAGLYESSGDWLYDVGLPGKSGIGGGGAGKSVKGQLAARFLSGRLGLDLFGSRPVE